MIRGARDVLAWALLACSACTSASHHESGGLSSAGSHVRGLRHGPWTNFYPSGAKQSEGRYENDIQTDAWTYWFENGNKEMEGRFTNERRDGEWTSWYENGALRACGRFESGFEEGVWRFHDRSGALEHEGAFELGKPVLRWTYFDANGAVRETGRYLAGVKVGTWTTRDASEIVYPTPTGYECVEERFDDSALKRIGFVRDGTPVGRWHSFHPGGKLRLECTFVDGSPTGSAHAWREDGTSLASGELRDGCVVGKWTVSRDGAQRDIELRDARPRSTFRGEWSPASSAELPGWSAVEAWVAEMCSPLQPPPIAAATTTPSAAAAPDAESHDLAGIPARAQPWTEYERRALPGLVKLYGGGVASIDDEYEERPALRSSHPNPQTSAVHSDDLVGKKLPMTRFTAADGSAIDLAEFSREHNVLVTILRGFGGQVCVYCTAQTKALADFAGEFEALDTKVVVVYPGPASGLPAFREAYRRTFGADETLPYAMLYDSDLRLTRALHIEDNIAVPTSLLLDRDGVIRWCRVAKSYADRPSAQEILTEIKRLSKAVR
jgi:antitoxin component YwqK of YwqJK toxin-antitoxin module/peroxiredoxin